MGNYCVGVDIGGTSIKYGLFDITGQLHDKWQLPTDVSDSGCHIVNDIAGELNNRFINNNINKADIKGIGVGVPGMVTGDGCVSAAVNLGWKRMPLADELSRLTGIPVRVSNDANAAAMGEMWQGGGKGSKNLVMLTIGTGIGGGVIIDGKIVTGLFGAAGEFGHMTVVHDEDSYCNCGRKGCLEQAASARGIAREAERLLSTLSVDSVLRTHNNITAHAVIEAAKAGDELALKVMERAGRYLGLALALISGVIDPEVYIIGGGVSKAGQFLIDIIKKYYRENVLYVSKDTVVKLAQLGNDAGIYGAAGMVI